RSATSSSAARSATPRSAGGPAERRSTSWSPADPTPARSTRARSAQSKKRPDERQHVLLGRDQPPAPLLVRVLARRVQLEAPLWGQLRDLLRHRRPSLDDLEERLAVELVAMQVGLRDDGGAARRAGEERHLAEELAGLERRDPAVPSPVRSRYAG